MKRFGWGTALYLLALVAVAYGLLKIFNAEQHLDSLNWFFACLSAFAYLLNMVFWGLGWAEYFGFGTANSLKYGFAAQIGGLTPMSLGADYLRGYFAKKHGANFVQGFAASLAAKFHKILISLLVSAIGIGILLFQHTEVAGSVILGVVIPLIILAGLLFLTRNYSSVLISAVTLKRIPAENAREFSNVLKKFIYGPSKRILLLLLLSLATEFASFYFAFSAFGIPLGVLDAYLVFILLFFASKAFFVPQGLGIAEIVGLVLLSQSASTSLIAAALLVWNIVRVWIPTIISGMALMKYGGSYGK